MPLEQRAYDHPDRIALLIEPEGVGLTYAEVYLQQNRIAADLAARGLRRGDVVAICMENRLSWGPIVWAALLHGFHIVPIAPHLRAVERAYILRDCGAKALFVSSKTLPGFDGELPAEIGIRVVDGPATEGFAEFDAMVADGLSVVDVAESGGALMVYSSGTTGYPKGIKRALEKEFDPNFVYYAGFAATYSFKEGDVYFSPAPLYHTMPLANMISVMINGGTAILQSRFDAAESLRAIEKYRVTAASMVPTMFVRMLQLPDDVRARYDLSSLRTAVHAGAPCPVATKRAMIDWWGPILMEFYSGSEGVGSCAIDSKIGSAIPVPWARR